VQYAGVVHNGVDIHTHPFRAEKEDFLVFLGRSNREKAPELAIDVAQAVSFLLSDEAGFINGSIVHLEGGTLALPPW